MENKELKQHIPEDLKDAQLDAVTGGQDVDAALMEKINAMIDAVKNDPNPSRISLPRQTITNQVYNQAYNNLRYAEDAAHQIVPRPPEPQLQRFEVSSWERVRTESPEDALWTKK